ncbi:MAG: BamA/TamA family outer membrane protein [Longimicrobiales bacterium]
MMIMKNLWRASAPILLHVITPILFALLLSAVVATRPLGAQQTAMQTLIPDSTIERVIALYNRDATTRFTGETRIASGTVLTGDVAALNGPLEIAGHVTGDVVVINGDVRLLQGAVVDGSVTAVGGTVRLDEGARVIGAVMSYRELLRLRAEGQQISHARDVDETAVSTGHDFVFGRTDILLAMRGSYNRVEGLPLAIGPRFTIGSSTPTRLQAIMIYRFANGDGADIDRVGYFLRGDQYITRQLRFEGRVYREISAIEDWDLSAREASLAAFLLHHDYRDHYERRGWSIGAGIRHPAMPLDISVQFRDEKDQSVTPNDPIALMRNGDEWRPEPLVAEGRLQSVSASIDYDSRNDQRDPADGWFIRAFIEKGLGGSLSATEASLLPTLPTVDEFIAARFDIRRYARLTPYSRIALRIIASGSLDGGPLPPQRQQTLGGEGSLPAYPLFAFDCGARRTTVERGREFYPYYGCDRLAIMQLEFQAGFPFARKIVEHVGVGSWLINSVRWAAFIDTGRAWTESDSRNGRAGGSDDFAVDAGLGLRFGPLGIYAAVPLSGSDHKYNVFIRLGPRL